MSRSAVESAMQALVKCLPEARPIALHEPTLSGHAWDYIKDCLDTNWVSTGGSYVGRFERMLESFTGIPHAIATVNGTAALHVAMVAVGIGPGDEVIVPSLTFIATANAVSYCGAVPHFADIETSTLAIDAAALDDWLQNIVVVKDGVSFNRLTNRPIKAVMPMHAFGHPADIAAILRVCERFGLLLIEDAAEAIGSRRDGVHVGSDGKAGALSFNGNKTITTGGGGAVLTRDPDLAQRLRHLTTTARVGTGWEFEHDEIGYNYRLPNINAALGCAQVETLPSLLAAKRRLAKKYEAEFVDMAGVTFLSEGEHCEANYWLNTLIFAEPADRDAFLAASNAQGIQTRPPWRLMHKLPIYRACPRMDLGRSEHAAARIANIPSSPLLGVA